MAQTHTTVRNGFGCIGGRDAPRTRPYWQGPHHPKPPHALPNLDARHGLRDGLEWRVASDALEKASAHPPSPLPPGIRAPRYTRTSPWHNWIARRPPEPKVTGSNPVGDTFQLLSQVGGAKHLLSRKLRRRRGLCYPPVAFFDANRAVNPVSSS